jgi:hypothetical protein
MHQSAAPNASPAECRVVGVSDRLVGMIDETAPFAQDHQPRWSSRRLRNA